MTFKLIKIKQTNTSTSESEMLTNIGDNVYMSEIQTGEYQTPYRIPTTGTGTVASDWNTYMFSNTGGTFTGNPSIDTTYYTSNTVI